MSILNILYYPNKNLRKIAKNVDIIDNNIINIINNLFDTMYYYNGIGLAATQVNIHKRIIIIDINNNKYIMINPILIYKSNTFINTIEGCLSIPNIYEKVKRYDYIEIEYININNIKKNIKINKNSSLLLSCIQHEIDHLNGILFIDKISDIKKYLIFKKLNKK